MKKLMYLLVAGSLSVFAACGGACSADCAKECCAVEEVVAEDVAVEDVAIEEVAEAKVELTFDPPWTRDLMSEEAKLELGFL